MSSILHRVQVVPFGAPQRCQGHSQYCEYRGVTVLASFASSHSHLHLHSHSRAFPVMRPCRKRQRGAECAQPLAAPSPAIESRVLDFDKRIGSNAGDAPAHVQNCLFSHVVPPFTQLADPRPLFLSLQQAGCFEPHIFTRYQIINHKPSTTKREPIAPNQQHPLLVFSKAHSTDAWATPFLSCSEPFSRFHHQRA